MSLQTLFKIQELETKIEILKEKIKSLENRADMVDAKLERLLNAKEQEVKHGHN